MSARAVVRPPDLGANVVARIREAMEFRCFTVDDLAGATDMQPTILARRLVEPGRLMLCEQAGRDEFLAARVNAPGEPVHRRRRRT